MLRFSEPLVRDLSSATVVVPGGDRVEGSVSGERKMDVRLTTNAPGIYRVEWTTVSPLDGHTLRGAFRFGVGVDPGDGAGEAASTAPSRADLILAVARAVEYAALLLALGMILVRRLGRRRPELEWVRPRITLAVGAALVAGVAVILGEAMLAANGLVPGRVMSYLTNGSSGWARVVRLAAEAAAALLAVRRMSPLIALSVAVAALATAGHAAAASPRWFGIAADTAHLLAAGLWAGAIGAMATLRPPGRWRGREGTELLRRFSPVAVPAFLLTVGFGILRGAQEMTSFRELFTTGYGTALLLKVLAVLAMVPLSTMAFLRLRTSVRAEAVVAVLVVALAALLAAYPLPPRRLVEAEAGEAQPRGRSGLPAATDLTLGGQAGEALVGLTLRPAEPGPNDVVIYVLPLEGEEAAEGIPVRISAGAGSERMRPCGVTCRAASLDLLGGEEVTVEVGGGAGGVATFEVPSLPPAAGGEVFDAARMRMEALGTYRLEERLSSGRATLRADYAFQAPDRMRIEVSSGNQRIVIGDREWSRKGPGKPWTAAEALPPRVPRFIWDRAELSSPFLVGTDRVEGRPASVVSLFSGGGTPIWFRLWIDPAGLVRRAEMRAQGHFMDHRYFAFDAPFEIAPPPETQGTSP